MKSSGERKIRERGELVEAPVKLERKGLSSERSTEALKNHSEAERRRRARINTHLDTLRTVIPGAMKVCSVFSGIIFIFLFL
ncbi:Myc-type [Vigna unguiculata]|uniref:Myc-type n=1 Tax=Vigna unguiculata TaxID=3917 RepID=A0A4D6NS42_VIGUN|nr:Myc-type [Vigna unguiculata]